MALFVNQNSNRSKLQERLAAELMEKSKQKAAAQPTDRPDGVSDSQYLEGTKATTSLAWVWILIFLAAMGALVWYFVKAVTSV